MKIRTLLCALVATAGLLAGCRTPIVDATPRSLEANPSGIYTFSTKLNLPPVNLVQGSLVVEIVINGETHRMEPSRTLGKDYYEFEYRVPQNVSDVVYYYVVNYDYMHDGQKKHTTMYSTHHQPDNRKFTAHIRNRYVVMLNTPRSPAGVPVTVMGAGFRPGDTVTVDGTAAETKFVSDTTLSFTVPSLPSGGRYDVEVVSGDATLPAGALLIDSSKLTAEPARITIAAGQREQLVFFIDGPAPQGGLFLNVETDIPSSVIMPEVSIPQGARSVSVTVEGGTPGNGSIWVSAPGYDELRVPVSVE